MCGVYIGQNAMPLWPIDGMGFLGRGKASPLAMHLGSVVSSTGGSDAYHGAQVLLM